MVTVFAAISALAAAISCAAAAWSIQLVLRQAVGVEGQAAAALEANKITINVSQIDLAITFSERYLKINEDDGPINFSNEKQVARLWNLHYLEFFCFRRSTVPSELYGLWMIDLARLYVEKIEAWASHKDFMGRYREGFRDMYDFFLKVHEVSVIHGNSNQARDEAVVELVKNWLPEKT